MSEKLTPDEWAMVRVHIGETWNRSPTQVAIEKLLRIHDEHENEPVPGSHAFDLAEMRILAAKLIRVRLITRDLADSVKARRNDIKPTGMHVPYMGPFSSAVPSVLRDLDRLVRDLTEATDGEEVDRE